MQIHRRSFLGAMLATAGAVGLRSLATGLPIPFLLNAKKAAAAGDPPTLLILSTSRDGDPLNANCPGSYVPGITHPASFDGQDLTLGKVQTKAAKPWVDLVKTPGRDGLLSQLAFIHHRNGTVAHTELESLLRINGAAHGETGNGVEMLPSLISSENYQALGVKQAEPLSVGVERMSFQSRWLDNPSPTKIKALFGNNGTLDVDLPALRAQTIDAMYGQVKSSGSRLQRDYLERWSASREQAKALGSTLGVLNLTTEEDLVDGAGDQIITALAMLGLGLSSVVTIHIPFGGDNHQDPGLAVEEAQTTAGVAAIGFLWDQLQLGTLKDRVTFATLNVFGRGLKGTNGRGHNGNHHVMVMFGPRVQAGVYGGAVPLADGSDFGGSAMDSQSGMAKPDGDIDEASTLRAAAATLATAVGVPADRQTLRLPGAKRIVAATR